DRQRAAADRSALEQVRCYGRRPALAGGMQHVGDAGSVAAERLLGREDGTCPEIGGADGARIHLLKSGLVEVRAAGQIVERLGESKTGLTREGRGNTRADAGH